MEQRNSDLTPEDAWLIACDIAKQANFIKSRREALFEKYRIDRFPALRSVLENEDIYVLVVHTASKCFFNMMGRKIFHDGETARERFIKAYRHEIQLIGA